MRTEGNKSKESKDGAYNTTVQEQETSWDTTNSTLQSINVGRGLGNIIAESADITPLLVHPYKEEGDNEARLCCSECGEYVELVPDAHGAVCGCEELPAKWVMGRMGGNNED